MHLVHHKLEGTFQGQREVALVVDRIKLSKSRWRGAAADGTEFAFDLHHPLKHGDAFYKDGETVYTIQQEAESVLEVTLNQSVADVAKLAWSLGNLHQPLHIDPNVLRVKDDTAVRSLLQNLHVDFQVVTAVFQPTGHPAHTHHHHA